VTRRRRFNQGEAVALYLAADGKCGSCGVRLESGWHADHIHPWARGGETDVRNGQALCPKCNQQKGSRMGEKLGRWPEGRPLRDWQAAFYDRLRRHEGTDFLLVACPGSGKTTAALYVAHRWLSDGRVDRVMVVCHTETLKEQWSEAAGAVGIVLRPDFLSRSGEEAVDEHGLVVTYQQVASSSLTFRKQCSRPTLVILDEIHHAGEGNTWATKLLDAFGPATFRLCLSGTPFRTDGLNIPFVAYDLDADGEARSRADFRYDYQRACRDEKVCREVIFPNFEGHAEWEREGEFHSGYLTDECNDEGEKLRLRMVLDPRSTWIPDILRSADERLTEIRRGGHAIAGGLVIASDQEHAVAYADCLENLTGERPSLAISDLPKSKDVIDHFRASSSRWLVAVKMVSEGVDIKRLRVGVYATNVLTELHFRQVVGRFCRYDDLLEEDQQEGCLFIPAIKCLVEWASRVKQEHAAAVQRICEEVLRDLEEEDRERREGVRLSPIYVDGGEARHLGDISDESNIPAAELLRARVFAEEAEITGRVRLDKVAIALRKLGVAEAAGPGPQEATRGMKSVPREKRDYRKTINSRVAGYVHQRWPGLSKTEFGRKMAEMHERLRLLTDKEPADKATLEGLKQRLRLLTDWLNGHDEG
jgi:superfamily II DNA or RNA helicase